MKKLIFFLAFNALAQEAVLRYGGPETRKNITGITIGANCTVKVPGHGYPEGQLVYITQATGVLAANGAATISVVSADEIALNKPCEGTWRSPSGYIGIAQKTAINDFPRGPLDGSAGPLTSSLPSKKVAGWPVYDALLQRAVLYTAQPYENNYNQTAISEGWAVKDLFLLWKATGSIAARDAAVHYLNNFEKIGVWKEFRCVETLADCGTGSGSHLDWGAFRLANFVTGFAIGGDQLNAAEQATFRAKVMNGFYGDSCIPTPQGVNWAAGNCGALWWVNHHTYQPVSNTPGKTTTLGAAITSITQTTIKLNRSKDIPFFPVYLLRGTEWMKVTGFGTGVDELIVERGVFNSIPITHPINAAGRWTETQFGKTGTASNITSWAAGNQIEYDESNTHNLVFAKHFMGITAGIALPNIKLLEQSWNGWYDSSYNFGKTTWTGLNQGGSSYGNDRWNDWSTDIAIWAKNSLTPAIDILPGKWLKDGGKWFPHFSLPGNPKTTMPFADAGIDTSVPLRRWKAAMKVTYLYPDDEFTPQINYFLNTYSNYMTQAQLYAEVQAIGAAFLFTSSTPLQMQLEDKHFFFSGGDTPDSRFPGIGYNGVASRNDWTINGTLVGSYALSLPQDHTGSYPCPGNYAIVKGSQWLVGSDATSNLFGTGSATLANCNAMRVNGGVNQLPVWGISSMATNAGSYGQYVFIEKNIGKPEYAYWRINGTNSSRATAGVTSHKRDFVHLKVGQDYTIVYDRVNLAAAKPIEWTVHHPTIAASGFTPTTANLTGNTFTFTRGSLARMIETVLLPETVPVVTSNAGGLTLTSTVGTADKGEWLIVHRASNNANDSMPPLSLLPNSPAGFVALEIADSGACRLALIANTDELHDALTVQASKCVGLTTELFASGFSVGSYYATLNGTPIAGVIEVDASGALYIPAIQGGLITIIKGPPPTPPDPTFDMKCKVMPNQVDLIITCISEKIPKPQK